MSLTMTYMLLFTGLVYLYIMLYISQLTRALVFMTFTETALIGIERIG